MVAWMLERGVGCGRGMMKYRRRRRRCVREKERGWWSKKPLAGTGCPVGVCLKQLCEWRRWTLWFTTLSGQCLFTGKRLW